MMNCKNCGAGVVGPHDDSGVHMEREFVDQPKDGPELENLYVVVCMACETYGPAKETAELAWEAWRLMQKEKE